MKAVTLQFPVHSFRRIETPFERDPGYKNYLAIVDIFDVPDLKDWRDINVRDAKTRGRVPEAIRESLTSRPDEFVFLNRGLVIAAERVEMQDTGKDKILRITFADPQLHGLLDGGHTYQIIQETKPTLGPDEPRRFVKIELLTGFDDIVQVVDARNTSNQVAQESLDNLDGQYDPLKNILANQPYHNQIAWSEYEILPDGEAKPISVRDIIA